MGGGGGGGILQTSLRSWVEKGYIKPADWYVNVLLNNPVLE